MTVVQAAAVFVLSLLASGATNAASAPAKAPGHDRTIWMSDLYSPPADPDDFYDLAVGMVSTTYRPSLVVIDRNPARKAARKAVRDLWKMTGGTRPHVVRALAIRPQVHLLKRSPDRSVRVVTLGSLASLSKLIRARPGLVSRKVKSVVIFAGDASPGAPAEYNVALNPRAFLTVMTSGLKLRWVPCFDGGIWQAGTSSYTVTSDSALLGGASPPVFDWFDRYIGDRFGVRNLWAGGLLSGARLRGARWREAHLSFNQAGQVDRAGRYSARVKRLVVKNRPRFRAWMVRRVRKAVRVIGERLDRRAGPQERDPRLALNARIVATARFWRKPDRWKTAWNLSDEAFRSGDNQIGFDAFVTQTRPEIP